MQFIGMGALVADYYYEKDNFLGRMNGKSFQNICVNLKHLGQNVMIYGTVGNDDVGAFLLSNLEKLKINVWIKEINKLSHRIYITREKSSREWEGVRYWYLDNIKYPLKVSKEDIVIVDNFSQNTLKNLQGLTCEKALDIGHATSLLYLSKEKIIKLLKDHFTIINLNERAFKVLQAKLNVSVCEICSLLGLKFLIVTYGAKGILFATSDYEKMFRITTSYTEVDANGAGDAFFAIILDLYVKHNRVVNESFFEACFKERQRYVYNVLNHYGAIGHILELQK